MQMFEKVQSKHLPLWDPLVRKSGASLKPDSVVQPISFERQNREFDACGNYEQKACKQEQTSQRLHRTSPKVQMRKGLTETN